MLYIGIKIAGKLPANAAVGQQFRQKGCAGEGRRGVGRWRHARGACAAAEHEREVSGLKEGSSIYCNLSLIDFDSRIRD